MTSKKQVKEFKLNKLVRILFWSIGVLLGLFLILVVGFKIWMSTWQTYAENNISVKYPNGWFVDNMNTDGLNKDEDEDYLVLFDNAKQSFDSSGYRTDRPEYVRIIITRFVLKNGTSLESYANNNFWTKNVDRSKYPITRDYILINGTKSVLDFVNYYDRKGDFDKKYYYWLGKDNYVYSISRFDETSTNWFTSIFYQLVSRQIVHSFKIL